MAAKVLVFPRSFGSGRNGIKSAQPEPTAGQHKCKAPTRKPFHTRYPPWRPPPPTKRAAPPQFPISDEQFAKLERACGHDLKDLRSDLAEYLNIVVDGDWRRANNDARKEALARVQEFRTSITKATRDFWDAQLTSLPGLRACMLDVGQASYPSDARLPATEQEVLRTLVWLQRIANSAVEAIERTRPAAGPGQPERAALHFLIGRVAAIHLQAGGMLRPQKPQRSQFLEFVHAAYDLVKAHLPAPFRSQSPEALRKIAAKVIKEIEEFNRRLDSQPK
jgi:hypothetical protein